MSIINDAVKKARKEFEVKNKSLPVNITEEKITAEATPESSEIKWMAIVVVTLVLIASLLGSVLLYKHMSKTDTAYKPAMLKAKEYLPTAFSSERQKSGFSTVDIEDFVELNGIVYGSKDKWAIINNKIVREGEIFLDSKIAVIAKDFVKIKKDSGEEIILELK